ncbi:hypothetical protein Pfo_019175 [Paulownia fortunei]|nr:hypothetical protein Pfo_019175 [Paulownia fortunei]
MGKGGGCVPSKKKLPIPTITTTVATAAEYENDLPESTPPATNNEAAADEAVTTIPSGPPRNLKLLIVFYSMYGHRGRRRGRAVQGTRNAAQRSPCQNAGSAEGRFDSCDRVPADLAGADGFLFGFPTRYGCMAAQMKAFFDSTGQLWREQKLAGKPAGFFVSTGTQGGGQETTAWTAITQLAHHGMLFVPIGYTFGAGMFKMDSIRGGSPYGAGVFAGDGTREPSETELALAEHQGKYMAAMVKRLAQG